MSIWKVFLDLIEAEHQQSHELKLLRHQQREEFHLVHERLSKMERDIFQILLAVVPEPVSQLLLTAHSGETTVDIQTGQKSTLTFSALGASGNPTIPVGTPTWQATDTANFTLDVAPDSQSAVLTATGAAGSLNDVTVTVDGITSNAVSYAIVAGPAEPVASVVLTGTSPA